MTLYELIKQQHPFAVHLAQRTELIGAKKSFLRRPNRVPVPRAILDSPGHFHAHRLIVEQRNRQAALGRIAMQTTMNAECSRCGCRHLYTVEKRPALKTTISKRRCRHCGNVFWTKDEAVTELPTAAGGQGPTQDAASSAGPARDLGGEPGILTPNAASLEQPVTTSAEGTPGRSRKRKRK